MRLPNISACVWGSPDPPLFGNFPIINLAMRRAVKIVQNTPACSIMLLLWLNSCGRNCAICATIYLKAVQITPEMAPTAIAAVYILSFFTLMPSHFTHIHDTFNPNLTLLSGKCLLKSVTFWDIKIIN